MYGTELQQLAGQAFAKAQATGNDFVMLSDPKGELALTDSQVQALCHRRFGIGGDGLIRAIPTALVAGYEHQAVENPQAYWFMDYRNSDGTIAEMCGNGVRAFVHFLIAEDLVDLEVGQSLQIGSRAGVKQVTRLAQGYAVNLGEWGLIFPQEAEQDSVDSMVRPAGWEQGLPALSITMGNPHTVVALPDAKMLQELNLLAAPEVSPVPEHGTNVEFVVPAEPLLHDGVAQVAMRVHERGVGETLSCGTGACAAAAAVRYWARGSALINVWSVEIPGGFVGVEFQANNNGGEDTILSGPAQLVARGVIGTD
ncbi:diaminopimelate epimerase [Glutamicibacter uratoxydans]|uniref:Diaminopimelate epimerase n=1 Tax=Glutamicibacter uratoxydans TaxID=43667 RepID=A0A4Y4DPT1_GLUUR|nr:diaminopimelate epimerase [Glutamicibacter uratoxydans]GED06623.1 diaminopimelate epimerase [Glutamicibacter uratoxydans]